ncbi:protein of unknown function [Streptantibioticus cattleyicolor NRRL 8057 = DSM 46488]|nr:protein of unknown function [Streptantibioticus cattleyicolor NRRL 8057 = DSM 46488]
MGTGHHEGDTRNINPPMKGNFSHPGGQITYGDLSPKAKQLARALENGPVTIGPGEVSASHLAELQKFNSVEHAAIQGPDGDLRLIQGEQARTVIPRELGRQGYRFIVHTHPEDRLPGPLSDWEKDHGVGYRLGIPDDEYGSMKTDMTYKRAPHLEAVISRNGEIRFFDDRRIHALPPGEYPVGGPVNDRGYIVPVPKIASSR